MDQHHHPPLALFISIFSTIIAWVSIQQVQVIMTMVASCTAIVSALFAARYYYFATKEKKHSLKKNKDGGH